MTEFVLGKIKFTWKGNWAVSTAYEKDDIVKYGGNTYVCITGHTSGSAIPDFYTDIAKWNVHVEGIDFKDDFVASTFYKLNDIVKWGGNQYRCSTQHTASTSLDYTKFQLYLEGLQFEDSWSGATLYQSGDIVTYGGYAYVAKIESTNVIPFGNASEWEQLVPGFESKGDWAVGTAYKVGDVLKWGGNSYVCIADATAGTLPTDTSKFHLMVEGLKFLGTWAIGTDYKVGEVVNHLESSYVSIVANTGVTPGTDPAKWGLLSQGDPNAVLTTRGDLLTRDATQHVRLGIGSANQILTSDGTDAGWSLVGSSSLGADLTFTGAAVIVPVGTTAERPGSPANGMLRYNTDLTQYEAYKNGNWGSLGGSIDVDQDTYIEVETSPGADNDDISAFTAGTKRWETDQDGVMTYPGGYLQLPSFTKAQVTAGGLLLCDNATNPRATGQLIFVSDGGASGEPQFWSCNGQVDPGWIDIAAQPPEVTSVTSDGAAANQFDPGATTTVTIAGSNFGNPLTIKIGSTIIASGKVTVASATSVSFIIDPEVITASGTYDLFVTNPSGLAVVVSGALIADRAPKWTSNVASLGYIWENVDISTVPANNTYAVTVANNGTQNVFYINTIETPILELQEGGTYKFDISDASCATHDLRLSTTADGVHGAGGEYTAGVTTNGTPGQAEAYTEITVAASAPNLYYYCVAHNDMGGVANTPATFGFPLVATDPESTTLAYSWGTSAGNGGSGHGSGSIVNPTINATTGVIGGNMPEVSADTNINITVCVTDTVSGGTNNVVCKDYVITSKLNEAPVITSPATGALGATHNVDGTTTLSYQINATDPEGGGLTYAVTAGALPTGVTLDPNTGLISGILTIGSVSTQIYNFTVTISDTAPVPETVDIAYSLDVLVPFLYRTIITQGYMLGGYKDSTPWKNVNLTMHSTDTTTNLGDQLTRAADYVNGAFNNNKAFVWGTNDTFGTGNTACSAFDMFTEAGLADQSVYNIGTTRYDFSVMIDDNQWAYICAGGGSPGSAVDVFNLTTETFAGQNVQGGGNAAVGAFPSVPSDGRAEGASGFGDSNTGYGWTNWTNASTWYKMAYATGAWSSASAAIGANDGWGKSLSTKHGHTYIMQQGNTGHSIAAFNYSNDTTIWTGSTSAGMPVAHGEENWEMGQDWGYSIGSYISAQSNQSCKVVFSTHTFSTGSAGHEALRPKGHDGASSGSTGSRAAT
tara:strand:+ start:756 stop:4397 length:3642 start_codon:yes stop_codon:yes gene_type:complete